MCCLFLISTDTETQPHAFKNFSLIQKRGKNIQCFSPRKDALFLFSHYEKKKKMIEPVASGIALSLQKARGFGEEKASYRKKYSKRSSSVIFPLDKH